MTTTTLLQPEATARLSLNSFREAASQGETLHVVHDGSIWTVWSCSTGVTERFGSRPELAVDTTSIFADTLEQAFSPGIRAAVVRELGLEARPGQPLESRLVLQAIAMAQASQQALEGVDFMTRLMFGAATRSAGFVAVCQGLDLLPEAFSKQQREVVDARMQQRFSQAVQQGQSPVAPALAQQWLQAELLALQAHIPNAR